MRVSDTAGLNLPKVGYLVIPRQTTLEMLDAWLNPAGEQLQRVLSQASLPTDGAEVLATVERITPVPWPFEPGPVVRPAKEQIIFDVVAAQHRLQRYLTIPSQLGGHLVNSRATHFELVVQEAIDDSLWKPPEPIRDTRGRTLNIAGQAVTDIDAIAARGSRLLLVSCKSIPIDSNYDAGVYDTVRNRRTDLEGYLADWDKVILRLKSSPAGDNFDFSSFPELHGVVCTPHVMYLGELSQRIELQIDNRTLHAVCSVGELKTFLN
jgi:hypothetical protein